MPKSASSVIFGSPTVVDSESLPIFSSDHIQRSRLGRQEYRTVCGQGLQAQVFGEVSCVQAPDFRIGQFDSLHLKRDALFTIRQVDDHQGQGAILAVLRTYLFAAERFELRESFFESHDRVPS